MAIIDTTNVIDSSMFLKARLKKNMVGDNYYIENLQDKRNQDWELRYNVVGIEEEKSRQIQYTDCLPTYTPLDVVIRSVKGEKGEDLGADWASISFKDLKYPNLLGTRYRFSLDFPDMSLMTEEEKYFDTSVWIAINKSPIKSGCSSVVRRCNANIALVGSPTKDYHNIVESRYEPVILENELKYMNMYYNQTIVVPQAEWYITMQMNYFSNCIKVNNRVILGGTDVKDVENNSIYKVKAVIKCTANNTFARARYVGLEDVPLVVLAIDKDMAASEDDFVNRIAVNAPMYYVPDIKPVCEYYISTNNENNKIILGETVEYSNSLFFNGNEIDVEFEYEYFLNRIKQENWSNYFEFVKTSPNSFQIKNLKACTRGTLDIKIICANPTKPEEKINEIIKLKLGGFY